MAGNSYEIRFPIREVKSASEEPALLYGLVVKELAILAKRCRMDFSMVFHLIDPLLNRIQEELRKFSADPDKPWPPPGKTDMVLFVQIPEIGKLAQGVEWKEKVMV